MSHNSSRHFVIATFPDVGHINPTLEPARMLMARGHRVTYVVDEHFAGMAARTGARVVGYRSGRRRYVDGTFEDLGSIGIDFMQCGIDTVLPLCREVLRDDPPDVLLYDYENFVVARTLAREYDAPSVQLFPYLASNTEYSLRGEMFDFDFDNELVKRTVEILIKFLADNGHGPEEIWTFANEFDERNLVFLPREFQTRGETFDDRYTFVGPCFAPAMDVSWSAPSGTDRTVLISMGTEANEQPELLRTCATAFAGTDWHVVMTIGRGQDTSALSALAPNIEVHEWFPHTALLAQIDAFVCQGGVTSLMEALSYGVPAVVLSSTPDGAATGRQVAALGLGTLLDAGTVTSEAVREAVEHVVGDTATRERLDQMRGHIVAAGGAVRACEVLEAVR